MLRIRRPYYHTTLALQAPPRHNPAMTIRLDYGDKLDVLRDQIASESVDLVYLDPPFNSNANYNILFRSPEGSEADAQVEAFKDSWHWNDAAADAFDQVMRSGHSKAFDLLAALDLAHFKRTLDHAMVENAWGGAGDADAVVLLVDGRPGVVASVRGQLLDAHENGGASDSFVEVRMTLDQLPL